MLTFSGLQVLDSGHFSAASFHGFGDGRHAVGHLDHGVWATSNGGANWTNASSAAWSPNSLPAWTPKIPVLSSDGSSMHDVSGWTIPVNGTGLTSLTGWANQSLLLLPNGSLLVTQCNRTISISGIPAPGLGNWTDPTPSMAGSVIRDAGTGPAVALADGTQLVAFPVRWATGGESVLMAFRSSDGGYAWAYAGIVSDAAAAQSDGGQGASEHSMTVLKDGRVLCVMRVDDNNHYAPYHAALSSDGGRTWVRHPMPNTTGTVMPKLLTLPNGALLLAGGRAPFTGGQDPTVWHNAAGDAVEWQPYSISYWHNLLAPVNASNPYLEPAFRPSINTSQFPRGSTDYVGLFRSGESGAYIVYDQWLHHMGNLWRVFGMHIELDAPQTDLVRSVNAELHELA